MARGLGNLLDRVAVALVRSVRDGRPVWDLGHFDRSIFDLCSAQERSCWVRTTFEKTDIPDPGNARCNATSTGTILSTLQAPTRPARQNHPASILTRAYVLYFPTGSKREAIRRQDSRSRGPCLFFQSSAAFACSSWGLAWLGTCFFPSWFVLSRLRAGDRSEDTLHPQPRRKHAIFRPATTWTLFTLPGSALRVSWGPDGDDVRLS